MEFPTGMDYGWLAVDANGCVALFTNAGTDSIDVTAHAECRLPPW
jgi:hypothetical protein